MLAGTLFNVLFNLNKFIAFETRDPFVVRTLRGEFRAGAPLLRVGVHGEGYSWVVGRAGGSSSLGSSYVQE